jgi:hypothetical protein
MSIKFICSCGKRLRARDANASRRTICPRCGQLVGVPSLQPTHPGTAAAPMTPMERRKLARQRLLNADAPASEPPPAGAITAAPPPRRPEVRPDPGLDTEPPRPPDYEHTRVEPTSRKQHVVRWRYGWLIAPHWVLCLAYPFRAAPLVFGMALVLAILTGGALLALPEWFDLPEEVRWPMLLWGVIPVVLLGYVCGFLECALVAAAEGDQGPVRWPGHNLKLVVQSIITWLVCFLAGPVVPAVGCLLYWLYIGDLEVVDRIILGELVVLAVGYWMLMILAVSQKDGFLDVHPARVVELVQRVGHRVVAVAGVSGLVALGHGLVVLVAMGQLHRNPALGWLLLFLCWASGLTLATYVFRLLGGWCHQTAGGRARRRRAASG